MIRNPLSSFFLVVVFLGLAACEKAAEPVAAIDEAGIDVVAELAALYHEYDEEILALNPIFATFRGDHRFNDQWFPHDPLSDEYAAASLDINKRYLARLLVYDPENLEDQDDVQKVYTNFDVPESLMDEMG